MSIGTITSDPAIEENCHRSETGLVEESFISGIKPGGNFYFSGKLLTLKQVRDLTAVVTRGKKARAIPVWGVEVSLSSELAGSKTKTTGCRRRE